MNTKFSTVIFLGSYDKGEVYTTAERIVRKLLSWSSQEMVT